MSQTIQRLYEKFIAKNGARLDSIAQNIFGFSSDDVFVIANTDRIMRSIFEIEKANLFAYNRANPNDAKTKHYKFFDNTDEKNMFFAMPQIDEKFKFAMEINEDIVKDFDSDFSTGGASFVIFATNEAKIKSFLTGIRDLHMQECEISVDEKKSAVVPGLNIKLCSKDGEIYLKNNGEYRTKQSLDNMPNTLSKSISPNVEMER